MIELNISTALEAQVKQFADSHNLNIQEALIALIEEGVKHGSEIKVFGNPDAMMWEGYDQSV